jgi:hypothetical protein
MAFRIVFYALKILINELIIRKKLCDAYSYHLIFFQLNINVYININNINILIINHFISTYWKALLPYFRV